MHVSVFWRRNRDEKKVRKFKTFPVTAEINYRRHFSRTTFPKSRPGGEIVGEKIRADACRCV